MQTCPVCRKGFISPGGVILGDPPTSPACEPCPAGRTSLESPRTTCDGCAPGYGGTDCTMCAAGAYSPGGNIKNKTPDCLPCPAGTTSDAGAEQCGPVSVSPSPSPSTSPHPSPSTSPVPTPSPSSSPTPSPSTSPPPVITRNCAGFVCRSGVLRPNPGSITIGSGDASTICCSTCEKYCAAGNYRSNYKLPAGLAPTYQTCCNDCALVSCTAKNYPTKTPSPQLAPGKANVDLCCVVPPVQLPVVPVSVPATVCNETENQALAAATKANLVISKGLTPEEAATVDVKVLKCQSSAGRHLMAPGTVVTLGITIIVKPDSQPAEVANATKVLIQCLGVAHTGELAVDANLTELVDVLNKGLNVTQSDDGTKTPVAALLETVNAAIRDAGLDAVFENATEVATVVTAPASCPGLPSGEGVTWPLSCDHASIGSDCVGRCSSGSGQVTAKCLSDGYWSIAANLDKCKDAPPPVVLSCTTNPIAVVNALWSGCANQQQCTAVCQGNTKGDPGAPTAFCDTATGTWTTPVGACVPIHCEGVPSGTIDNGYWPTYCPSSTVGDVCSGRCVGAGSAPNATCTRNVGEATARWVVEGSSNCQDPKYPTDATCANLDGVSNTMGPVYVCGSGYSLKPIAGTIGVSGRNVVEAKSLCCDQLYGVGTTCTAFTCGTGYKAKPGSNDTGINGLVMGGATARTRCCDVLFPAGATCADDNGSTAAGVKTVKCPAGYTNKTDWAGISIQDLTLTEAVVACCDPLYPDGATCGDTKPGEAQTVYNCTGTGRTVDVSLPICGLTGAAALPVCCSLYPPGATCASLDGARSELYNCTDIRWLNDPNPSSINITGKNITTAKSACCTVYVFRYGNGATCTTANASLAYSCGQYYTIEAASADKSIVDQTDEEAWATCCSVARQVTMAVNNILPFRNINDTNFHTTIEDKQWYGTDLRNNTCNGTCTSYPYLGIDLLSAVDTTPRVFLGKTLNISTNLALTAPDQIDSALRFVTAFGGATGQGSDKVQAAFSFPNRHLGEEMGIFNGVKWSDFIKGGGRFQYDWYKATWENGCNGGGGTVQPSLHVRLFDPDLVKGGWVSWYYCEFVYEAIYNTPTNCPDVKQWKRESLNYTTGKVWVPGAFKPSGAQYYMTIRDWMENKQNKVPLNGWPGKITIPNSSYNFTGFFERAVIYDVRLGLASSYTYSWANNLKIVYDDYEWVWVFKAPNAAGTP